MIRSIILALATLLFAGAAGAVDVAYLGVLKKYTGCDIVEVTPYGFSSAEITVSDGTHTTTITSSSNQTTVSYLPASDITTISATVLEPDRADGRKVVPSFTVSCKAGGLGSSSMRLNEMQSDSDTVANWTFNGVLTSSPALTTPVTVAVGAVTYARARGLTGVVCNDTDTTGDRYATNDSDLMILGDMTGHALVQFDKRYHGTRQHVFGWDEGAGDGGAPDDNYAYALSIETPDHEFRYFSEGDGTNHTINSGGIGGHAPGQIFLFSFTRISNVVTVYVDGDIVAGPTTITDTPQSGATATFGMCANGESVPAEFMDGIIWGLKIKDVGESQAEVIQQAKNIGLR